MVRTVLAGVALAAALPSAATAAELTPPGPATLMNEWHGAVPMIGFGPTVLVGVKADVGEGSQAGTVRVRAGGLDGIAVGDPVELPAAPGTHTLPAPHVRWNPVSGQLGLEQTTGGHALVTRKACRPDLGQWADLCQISWITVSRAGAADERDPGARLALTPISEPDVDQDLRGDTSEDRTDLRVSLWPTRVNGRLRVEVTVTNAGPLAADVPVLEASMSRSGGRWEGDCAVDVRFPKCRSTSLPAGASRTFALRSDDPAVNDALVRVSSEGADLAPLDNGTGFIIDPAPSAPTFSLVAAKQQRLRNGVKLQVSGSGRSRVTVAFRVGKRTLRVSRTLMLQGTAKRTVTLRPKGATLRTLRRAAKRGPLRAEITVRRADGKVAVKATAQVL